MSDSIFVYNTYLCRLTNIILSGFIIHFFYFLYTIEFIFIPAPTEAIKMISPLLI